MGDKLICSYATFQNASESRGHLTGLYVTRDIYCPFSPLSTSLTFALPVIRLLSSNVALPYQKPTAICYLVWVGFEHIVALVLEHGHFSHESQELPERRFFSQMAAISTRTSDHKEE
jgi:hypothetical protein